MILGELQKDYWEDKNFKSLIIDGKYNPITHQNITEFKAKLKVQPEIICCNIYSKMFYKGQLVNSWEEKIVAEGDTTKRIKELNLFKILEPSNKMSELQELYLTRTGTRRITVGDKQFFISEKVGFLQASKHAAKVAGHSNYYVVSGLRVYNEGRVRDFNSVNEMFGFLKEV